MPNSLAFFPWLSVDAAIAIGDVRLIPFRRAVLPGNSPDAAQADIDAVLAAYALRKNQLVDRATLLEVGEWRNGQDADTTTVERLFRVRELLAFSAMSNRQLFRREQYSNFDTLSLTVQRFQAGSPGAFSFNVRRRDGGSNYMWDADEFTFLKPLHVEAGARLWFDHEMFDGLMRADVEGKAPFAAIVEFNRANTDSGDVPLHTEVVMMKSAFEYFFGIRTDVDEFVNALLPCLPRFTSNDEFTCPEFPRWMKRFPKATRPLEAWAREFCVNRNEAGHGARRGGEHHVWSQHSHLAFASALMPLLMRQWLVQNGLMVMSDRQKMQIRWAEALLGYDPFEPPPPPPQYKEHEWLRIQGAGVMGEVRRMQIEAALSDFLPPQ